MAGVLFVIRRPFQKCVCVPIPTHCTITCFGFRTAIDGIECGLFPIHAQLGQPTLSVLEEVEVRRLYV